MFDGSNIEDRIRRTMDIVFPEGMTLHMLADKLYTCTEMTRPLYSGDLTAEAQISNNTMQLVRLPHEWTFGKVEETWKGLFFKRAVKPKESPCAAYYIACIILTNAHTLLYGSEAHTYFSKEHHLAMPSLEEYFAF